MSDTAGTAGIVAPNWIVCPVRNNPDLVRRSLDSFLAQDIAGGVRVLIVNNESDGATTAYLASEQRIGRIELIHQYPQRGVAAAWNLGLRYALSLGGSRRTDRVLVCNSDAVLRSDTYRWLDADGGEFVTAVGSGDPAGIRACKPPSGARRPHPDFSCFLIRRSCYERVGPFDENFRGAFAEDCDYHVRMHQAGITAYAIDLPFWHVGGGSQTAKRADESERERISAQAAKNRAYFAAKHGFELGSAEYYAFFGTSAPEAADASDAPSADGGSPARL